MCLEFGKRESLVDILGKLQICNADRNMCTDSLLQKFVKLQMNIQAMNCDMF
jgi:hypothetical protein